MVQDDEIDLLEIWDVLMKRKVMIASVFFVTTLISVLYAFLAAPIYRAEVLLAPAQKDNQNKLSAIASEYGGLASLAGINLGSFSSGKTDEYIAVITSRGFISSFIRKENLMPILFDKQWDEDLKKWDVEPDNIPTIGQAYNLFNKVIKIEKDKATGLILLNIDWKDSVLAASMANKIVESFNHYQKELEVDEAKKSLAFLNNQLKNTNIVENKNTLYKLIEMNTKTLMLADITDEFAFKVLDPAVVPEKKVKPKRLLILAIGGIFGVILGVFIAFWQHFLNSIKEQRQKL